MAAWPLGLLLLEYLGVSLLVDAQDVLGRFSGLREIPLGGVATFAVAAGTATLLAGRSALFALLRDSIRGPLASPKALGLHVVAYLAFLGLTVWLGRGEGGLLSYAVLVGWGALGAANLATLVLTALPWSACKDALPRLLPYLGLGLAVGALAWGVVIGAGRSMWNVLRSGTFNAVVALLELVSSEVSQNPDEALLGLDDFTVRVAPQCSGIEGLALVSIFLGAYLLLARKQLRFPAAFWLLPVGIVLALASNVVRIAALLLIGAHVSPDVAIGGFHSKAGWVLFCAIALGLVALSQRYLTKASSEAKPGEAPAEVSRTAAYLMPLLALIATHLVTGLLVPGGDVLYALGIGAACLTLVLYRRAYRPEPWGQSWEGWVAGVLCGVGWVAFAVWTRPADAPPPEVPQLTGALWIGWVALRVFGSVLVVPVVEELAFRGYLLRRVVSQDFTEVPYGRFHWPAFLLSSAAFGFLHSLWLAGVLAGMLFALVAWRKNRLADAVVAHVAANAVVALYVLVWQDYALW